MRPPGALCVNSKQPVRMVANMAHRLTKIYTRTGDEGSTGLADGTRVAKDAARIEAMGAVDELNSSLGVLLAESLPEDVRACLIDIQHVVDNDVGA